ncbi:hypothetical protein ACVW1C_007458 [Bradyrhizobium sp. USDA 4011]
MIAAMDLGIADHGERAGREQAAEIANTELPGVLLVRHWHGSRAIAIDDLTAGRSYRDKLSRLTPSEKS